MSSPEPTSSSANLAQALGHSDEAQQYLTFYLGEEVFAMDIRGSCVRRLIWAAI